MCTTNPAIASRRGVDYLGASLDISYDDKLVTFAITSNGGALAVIDASGARHALTFGAPVQLPVQELVLTAA